MVHTKGPAPQHHDGSGLRIGIIHARWNDTIIEPLLAGTKAKLLECGVKGSNIVVQSVPGSWELPIAVQRCVTVQLSFPSPRPRIACCLPATSSSLPPSFPLHHPLRPRLGGERRCHTYSFYEERLTGTHFTTTTDSTPPHKSNLPRPAAAHPPATSSAAPRRTSPRSPTPRRPPCRHSPSTP